MSALEDLASRVTDLFKTSCRFECPRPVLIEDNTVATHLYRIAQEATTNAIKHGQAQRIEIRLSSAPEQITLTVSDDGVGFKAGARHPKGMGLRIMNHRASMIGGTVVVQKTAQRWHRSGLHRAQQRRRKRHRLIWPKHRQQPQERKQIFIVDDHPVFREGLVVLVKREADLAVCGEADNAPQALAAIERLKPDLVLVDIGLPGKSGLELIKDLRAVLPEIAGARHFHA